MSAQFAAPFLYGAPPPRLCDENHEQDDELSSLIKNDDALTAHIEELSGLRVGDVAWKKTQPLREELIKERRRIRNRMLAIGRD